MSLSLMLQEGSPNYADEIQQLREEGEMPLDQLLASLPPEVLEGNPSSPTDKGAAEKGGEGGESVKPTETEPVDVKPGPDPAGEVKEKRKQKKKEERRGRRR